MSPSRSYFFAVTCGLSLAVIGCGGDEKPSTGADAGNTPPPEGTHYSYVVSEALVPTTEDEESRYGLDLGTDKTNRPDGEPDNQLGTLLRFLAGPGMVDVQGTITEAVDQGAIILLADVQTTDFTTAAAAGFSIKIGTNPQPSACADDTDMTCRRHLDGNGMFTVAASSPANSTVAGSIASGTFNGGPGNLTLQIALGGADPITLNLVGARVKATGMSSSGLTAVIGGSLLNSELESSVLPAILTQVQQLMEADCPAPRTPPKCGCVGGLGTLVELLDMKMPDCSITLDELQTNMFLGSLLRPDVCSTASCTEPDALSFGLQAKAVKATF